MRKVTYFWIISIIILLISFGCVTKKVVDVSTQELPVKIPSSSSTNLNNDPLLQNIDIEILKPTDKTIYYEKMASIVMKVNSSKIDIIKIYQEDNNSYTINIKKERDVYCQTINLLLGNNKITVFGYKNAQKMSLKIKDIYYSMGVFKRYSFAPDTYEKNFFHSDKNEKLCKKCHDMSSNEQPNIKFNDPKESNCYTCHNSLTSRSFTHEPLKNWQCTLCHNGKIDRRNRKFQGKTKYLASTTASTTCLSCHKGKNAPKWLGKRFEHDPVEGGNCNKCHNSHGSENEFFIRRPVYELCGDCHSEKLATGHIIATFYSEKRHPVLGFDDPSRKGKKLSCISCHDPHASNHNYFLKRDQESVCLMCHEK